MNRPHFSMSGQSGTMQPNSWKSHGNSPLEPNRAGYQNVQHTAIEDMRRLMSSEQSLSAENIRELRDRVASGYYLSRVAAEQTAERLLDENFDLE